MSRKQQKIDWLLANQQAWEGFPKGVHGEERALFGLMVAAGLYSPRTLWVNADVYGLISEARKQRRHKAAAFANVQLLVATCAFWLLGTFTIGLCLWFVLK